MRNSDDSETTDSSKTRVCRLIDAKVRVRGEKLARRAAARVRFKRQKKEARGLEA